MSESRRTVQARRAARGATPVPPAPPASWVRFLPLVLLGAGLLAYHDGCHGPFVFDDIRAIVNNATIRRLSWDTIFPSRSAVFGRPFVNLSLALNYAVGGLEPTSYHVFNLAVHLLAALALFGVIRRTLELPALPGRYGDRAFWLAAAIALLWVVHPLVSESVLYTIQRTELLMGLFLLLAVYCLVRAATSPHPRGWYAGLTAAFVIGLGCKEVMLTALPLLLAYDRLMLAPSLQAVIRRRGILYAALVMLAVSYVAVVGMRFREDLHLLAGASPVAPLDYARTQCGVIVHYLRLALWPHPLVADYDDWPIASSLAEVLPSALLVGALLGITAWACVRQMKTAFLGLWFFVILAPSSSLWPIPREIAAERRMYLPLAAVIALVVLAGDRLLRTLPAEPRHVARTRAAGGVLLVAATILTTLTIRRSADYASTLDFWTTTVRTRPENARAHLALGGTLLRRGQATEALEHYLTAVRLRPDEAQAHYELGVTLVRLGRKDEGIEQYREALRLDPEHAEAHNDLGVVLAAQGNREEAIEHYRAAIRADPEHQSSHFNLGVALMRGGEIEAAISQLQTALELAPDDAATQRALSAARARVPR